MTLDEYVNISLNLKEYVTLPIEIGKTLNQHLNSFDINVGGVLVEVEHVGFNLYTILAKGLL